MNHVGDEYIEVSATGLLKKTYVRIVTSCNCVPFWKEGRKGGREGGRREEGVHVIMAKAAMIDVLIGWSHNCTNSKGDLRMPGLITPKQILEWLVS